MIKACLAAFAMVLSATEGRALDWFDAPAGAVHFNMRVPMPDNTFKDTYWHVRWQSNAFRARSASSADVDDLQPLEPDHLVYSSYAEHCWYQRGPSGMVYILDGTNTTTRAQFRMATEGGQLSYFFNYGVSGLPVGSVRYGKDFDESGSFSGFRYVGTWTVSSEVSMLDYVIHTGPAVYRWRSVIKPPSPESAPFASEIAVYNVLFGATNAFTRVLVLHAGEAQAQDKEYFYRPTNAPNSRLASVRDDGTYFLSGTEWVKSTNLRQEAHLPMQTGNRGLLTFVLCAGAFIFLAYNLARKPKNNDKQTNNGTVPGDSGSRAGNIRS